MTVKDFRVSDFVEVQAHERNGKAVKSYVRRITGERATPEEVEMFYAAQFGETPQSFKKSQSLENSETFEKFSEDSFYGDVKPRSIQIEPMNGVLEALETDDATQLIAACGTGKTYMGRQLMNQLMSKEDSNGIAVVLTSSIRLAHETAEDMRPDGKEGDTGYDHTFGTYGEDYTVIEVHSDAKMYRDEKSVREGGNISVDRIEEKMKEAIENNQKIIIVSTYDSCLKVQEAQERFENSERVEADILMHDEAHNILGQQTPTSISDDEELDNKAYSGFDNSLPGAIQSKKRMYVTATPILRESESDKESSGSLEEASKIAERMQNGDKKARITFYSDDKDIVGGVGGYISQKTAIDAKCLVKPEYQIYENSVRNLKNIENPAIDVNGVAFQRTSDNQMSVETYSAVLSTANAMVRDPEPGRNGTSFALSYCGSIAQSQAFAENFKKIAEAQSQGMSLEDARKNMNSEDESLKRRARMKLLSESVDVKFAHSQQNKADRDAAFEMFEGAEQAKSGEWSPNKKVLANVDIFSEGVNIPQIDTVVISDDSKTSERAMTQAIGRAIRVSSDKEKNSGYVIIPQAVDENNQIINKGSIALASYGATRVERGVSQRKLNGESVQKDTETKIHKFSNSGRKKGEELASTLATEAISSEKNFIASQEIDRVYASLSNRSEENFSKLNEDEKYNRVLSELSRRAKDRLNFPEGKRAAYTIEVLKERLGSEDSKISLNDIKSMSRRSQVMVPILNTGDISTLPSGLIHSLIKGGIITKVSGSRVKPTSEDKANFLEKNKNIALAAVLTPSANNSNAELKKEFGPISKNPGDSIKYVNYRARRKEVDKNIERIVEKRFEELKKDKEFQDKMFRFLNNPENVKSLKVLNNTDALSTLKSSKSKLSESLTKREANNASKGESEYRVNPNALTSTGAIQSKVIDKLIAGWLS